MQAKAKSWWGWLKTTLYLLWLQPLYMGIRLLFFLTSRVFYASFDVRGIDNIPPHGEPLILAFNHGNSLGDPMAIISCVNTRIIRFCAKNTLWKIPFFGSFVSASGAVPVYRKREHGSDAKKFNQETFSEVYRALHNGHCVGFSPEGVSSFRSHATKFKAGIAHIALEAVAQAVQNGQPDFKVKILPTVLGWTHREKFRSDILVRFRPVIEVDKSWLTKYDNRKDAAYALIDLIEAEYHENIITAPKWEIVKYAITATRIHRPLGTYMSLSAYMWLLRGWVTVLKSEPTQLLNAASGSQHTVGDLFKALESYQEELDRLRIKDERFRRIEMSKGKRPSQGTLYRIMAYRITLCSVLFTLCIPGLIMWSPCWIFIKKKERELLQRGIGWVDSLAETKMWYGFVFVNSILSLMLFTLPFSYFLGLIAYLWLTMRLFEDGMASARSICGIYLLGKLSNEQIETVLKLRAQAKSMCNEALPLFPKSSAENIMEESGDDVYLNNAQDFDKLPRWWTNFNPLRRRKKDWNELLRLSDYCTMDYVE